MTRVDPDRRRQLLTVRDRLRVTLGAATGERHLRSWWVDDPDGGEMAWTVHERDVVLAEVNTIRRELGRVPPVTAEQVRDADQESTGHADWIEKFVWRCAELAVTDKE